jgi:hypothetical protein
MSVQKVISNTMYGLVMGEVSYVDKLTDSDQLWETGITAGRFVFTFACLKMLKTESPFDKKMVDNRWLAYLQNACYILILTHAFVHAPFYSLTTLTTNDGSLPYGVIMLSAVIRLISGLFYFTEKISV